MSYIALNFYKQIPRTVNANFAILIVPYLEPVLQVYTRTLFACDLWYYINIYIYLLLFSRLFFSISRRIIMNGSHKRARDFTLRMTQSLWIYQTPQLITGLFSLWHLLRWHIIICNTAARTLYYSLSIQFTKTEVHQFKIGMKVPNCLLRLRWTGGDEVKPLVHRVRLRGAKPPSDYFYIRYYPSAAGKDRF